MTDAAPSTPDSSPPKRVLGNMPAPPMHWVGDGFAVRAMFSHMGALRAPSPFLMLDYAAPRRFEPSTRARGVGQHPHRGFETVTIVYQGKLAHRDSTGQGGEIGAGDVQWMTAGSGIVHEEFHSPDFSASGGSMQMAQLWVNLPARHKMTAPAYQAISARAIPTIELPGGAGRLRVIAGEAMGHRGPARTFTRMQVWDLALIGGREVTLRAIDGWPAMLVVFEGQVRVDDIEAAAAHTLILDAAGVALDVCALRDSTALLLTGEPIDEPVVGYGPFVMNTREEIVRAFEDFNAGRFGVIARAP